MGIVRRLHRVHRVELSAAMPSAHAEIDGVLHIWVSDNMTGKQENVEVARIRRLVYGNRRHGLVVLPVLAGAEMARQYPKQAAAAGSAVVVLAGAVLVPAALHDPSGGEGHGRPRQPPTAASQPRPHSMPPAPRQRPESKAAAPQRKAPAADPTARREATVHREVTAVLAEPVMRRLPRRPTSPDLRVPERVVTPPVRVPPAPPAAVATPGCIVRLALLDVVKARVCL